MGSATLREECDRKSSGKAGTTAQHHTRGKCARNREAGRALITSLAVVAEGCDLEHGSWGSERGRVLSAKAAARSPRTAPTFESLRGETSLRASWAKPCREFQFRSARSARKVKGF